METVASPHNSSLARLARLGVALVLAAACIWATWLAARMGLSRMFAGYGFITGELGPVDQALRIVPADPDVRVNRAFLLSQRGEYSEAAAELERATQLRPRDYYLWLELGMTRDQIGDAAGAERAFRESARLAPHYAQPAWQFGNLLFRLGRQDEAFPELLRAVRSDSTFLPGVINLAWAARPDPAAVRETLQPQTSFEHITLAHFFAKHGEGASAVAEFRSAGVSDREDIRSLIKELIAQRSFRDAHEVWAHEYLPGNSHAENDASGMYDGGFEKPLELNEPGFGWQVSQNIPTINLSLDPNNANEGAKSLRIDFRGISNPAVTVASQIILVDPKTHYRLEFAGRVQELVSGGLPVVVVTDAGLPNSTLIESQPMASGTDQWRESVLDFTTGPQTQAVQLQLRRKFCASEPCPIFGSLWLDAFSLRKVGPGQ
jgi:tetratricopeptide (TPR) repeat protein